MKSTRRRNAAQPMLPGDWPEGLRPPPRRLEPPPPPSPGPELPPRRSRNPIPQLVNPLAGFWAQMAIDTVDECNDPGGHLAEDLEWARRAFYLGADAVLFLLANRVNRWHLRAEIDRVLHVDDDEAAA